MFKIQNLDELAEKEKDTKLAIDYAYEMPQMEAYGTLPQSPQ